MLATLTTILAMIIVGSASLAVSSLFTVNQA